MTDRRKISRTRRVRNAVESKCCLKDTLKFEIVVDRATTNEVVCHVFVHKDGKQKVVGQMIMSNEEWEDFKRQYVTDDRIPLNEDYYPFDRSRPR